MSRRPGLSAASARSATQREISNLKSQISNPMKLAVWLPNWIGDVAMATPALRALRQHFADAEIVGVLRPYVADVLAGTTLLDRVLIHDPKESLPDRSGWRFLKTLRRERFDVAIVLPNSFRSVVWAWASGAKRILGYARNG